MPRLLILGGTSEASALARALAGRPGMTATLSLAGRTKSPAAQALPTRIGGFGGARGLADYLIRERIDLLVDATHPFAAIISANAAEAAEAVSVPLLQIVRPGWRPGQGDDWIEVADMPGAAAALGAEPRRVFLAMGRLEASAFEAAPQHHYVLRSIDPPDPLPRLPKFELLLARPPFNEAGETALLRARGIDIVVTKNSGGEATAAKLVAARNLRLPVVMVARPALPAAERVASVAAALDWLAAHAGLAFTDRGE